MKKSLIALSVAAALGGGVGTASAQSITATTLEFNPDGVGHILIAPYYSAQGSNATLFSIVNTDTVNGKAVKVRFRGASNSDDVFDFQVFLSPGDVWTASVTKDADGVAKLTTTDNSCTVPAKNVAGGINVVSFQTLRLNVYDLNDAQLANETREGYIEFLNMGDIPPTGGRSTGTAANAIYTATKHNSSGVAPCTTATLENIAVNDTRLAYPTTGLFANWTIIDVPSTYVWTGEAAAIEARTTTGGPAGTGRVVYWPQAAVLLDSTTTLNNTADPLFRQGAVDPAQFDLPDLSTPYTNVTIDSTAPLWQAQLLNQTLAARVVAAEYISSTDIQARTDWVLSSPVRRYNLAVDYADGKFIYNNNLYYYPRSGLDGNVVFGSIANGGKPWQACVQVGGLQFWDREEVSPSNVVISPAFLPYLCGEVSVVSINSPTSPLHADVARVNLTLTPSLRNGWGMVTLNGAFSNYKEVGLPVLTTQFSTAFNSNVGSGMSGAFAGTWQARVKVKGMLPN